MQPYVNDLYAPLAHIPEMLNDHRPNWVQSWVDPTDARRLTAYTILGAYRTNTRRFHLPKDMWIAPLVNGQLGTPPADNMREYGDAALFIDTARSLLLGDTQTIRCDHTETQSWLDEWAVQERLTQKLLEGEEHSIGDGDGVYAIGWSTTKNRPTVRVIDPGFYYPDVRGADVEEFPDTVHIAWEYVDGDITWIRRQTWTTVPLDGTAPSKYGKDRTSTVFYRVMEYDAGHLEAGMDVYSPELTKESHRRIATTGPHDKNGWIDLGIDFIPVVHVPNDPSTQRTFGRSLLLRVSMLLDDLAGNDTDLVAAAQQSNPALLTKGVDAGGVNASGNQLAMRQGESAEFIDTSKNLDALAKFSGMLLERISTTTRLPLALTGGVQPTDVPSGYALELAFHPARQLLREMRTVRDEKYPLILKFALRLAQVAGVLTAGDTHTATIELGASLPADKPAAIATVKDLLEIHAISTATAVKILIDAGLPIDDAEAEVVAIREERVEDAKTLVEATGDVNAARKMLGLPELAPLPAVETVPDTTGEPA